MKNKGFTLIELLVVIAIIALLLSIVIPSLQAAKEYASGAVCLSNQKQLCLAWTLYHENYDGKIVGGSNYDKSHGNCTPYRWVERPLYSPEDDPDVGGFPADADFTLEYRLNGIRAGALFTYTETVDIYNCPADKKYQKLSEPEAAFRSYSISGLMNSEDFGNRTGDVYSPIDETSFRKVGTRTLYCVTKFNDIKNPGNKYVFVEEDCGDQNFNLGGFVLIGGGNLDTWWDNPALYHNEKSTLGFADAHAEIRRWHDPRTLALMKDSSYTRLQPK